MNIRPIDLQKDRQTLLEFHAVTNYEAGAPSLRKAFTFEQFRSVWLHSRQTEEFLSALENSLTDPRTIAEIWEERGATVAYVWVKFIDWPEYNATGAEIEDILVAPDYRRRGIASQMFQRVEDLARERGATLLRSRTGAENLASQGLHRKTGFIVEGLGYEKEL